MSIEAGGAGVPKKGGHEAPELDWPEERLQARSRVLDAAVDKGLITAERAAYLRGHSSEAELGMAEAREIMTHGTDAVTAWLIESDQEYQRLAEELKPRFDPEA